jgi:SAM-dependent methyltransferase
MERALVIGCNRGEDCKIFKDANVNLVSGLDIMDEIGLNYQAIGVDYLQSSIEKTHLGTDTFDLVFAYATLEHVPNIEAAFREMARICKPGGTIYSASAPLWNSRYGPHWGDTFAQLPWAHLRFPLDEIIAYAQRDIDEEFRPSIAQIRSWLDDHMFNKRWAMEYVNACRLLSGVEIIRNDLEIEDESILPEDIGQQLSAFGYSKTELLALTHIFIARKI